MAAAWGMAALVHLISVPRANGGGHHLWPGPPGAAQGRHVQMVCVRGAWSQEHGGDLSPEEDAAAGGLARLAMSGTMRAAPDPATPRPLSRSRALILGTARAWPG
jgi:hypothetical protein